MYSILLILTPSPGWVSAVLYRSSWKLSPLVGRVGQSIIPLRTTSVSPVLSSAQPMHRRFEADW